MNTKLHEVLRLGVTVALLGAVFSPMAAFAQSELDTSEAEAFLGTWSVSMDTDFGAFDIDLKIEDQGGKVAVTVGAAEQGMTDVTDITRSGEGLVLSYEVDAQGQLIPVSVTLTLGPDGDALTAAFDFGARALSLPCVRSSKSWGG